MQDYPNPDVLANSGLELTYNTALSAQRFELMEILRKGK
jgi:hypothetical protein